MTDTSNAKRSYLFVAALTAQFGIFLSGVFYSWSSPVLVKLTNENDNPLQRNLTPTEQVWIISIGIAGLWIGCFLSGELSRKFGRRPSMILMTLPLLLSFMVLAFVRYYWLILLCRILGGITNGAMFTILPIYFGEIADPKSRGILGAAFNLFLNMGLLFSLSLGPYTSYKWFNIILAVFVLIYAALITFIIPESPYYLVEKDLDKAEQILKKIRGFEDVKLELKQIQQYVAVKAGEKSSFSEMIKSKTARKSLIIGVGIASFQQASGIGIIMGFGQLIFEEVDGFLPSDVSLIILGMSQVIFGLIAPIFTDRFGRKTLLICSYSGIAICLIIFGFYFELKLLGVSVAGLSWLPLVSMIAYMFSFGIGSGAVTFIMIAEIFPSRLKGKATSVANILASIIAAILANCYSILKGAIGIGFTMCILGSLSIAAVIFIHFCVVETKGKSLKEIQEMLYKSESSQKQSVEL